MIQVHPIQVRKIQVIISGNNVSEVALPLPQDIISDEYALQLINKLSDTPQIWPYIVSEVLTRPTPAGFVQRRPGATVNGKQLTFNYVDGNYAIATCAALARIGIAVDFDVLQTDVSNEAVESLCKLTLKYIVKVGDRLIIQSMSATQWGDCDRRSGMSLGSAKKGAATDGRKKCMHEFGWAADVYSAEPETVEPPSPEEMKKQSLESLYTIGAGKGLSRDQTTKWVADNFNGQKAENLESKDLTAAKRRLQRSEDTKEVKIGA